MKRQTLPPNSSNLEQIDNPIADAYHEYLKDRTVDYYTVVQRESKAARRALREAAKAIALKRRKMRYSDGEE
ncbi:MAG: hypothetical protein WBA77_10865 [Microcoleaceae cyanobacterium]